MSKFTNLVRRALNLEVYKDGYTYIILKDTEHTKYPKKYSEGVFAWYQAENDSLNISEEFQILNGGDPMVLKKYLLKQNNISEVE
tara:strand:- start:579 stop:833 length:255 start_codon:yes stop_codon:yes gene_type:complete